MDDITKVEALLDELIEADPDLAERFIESRLAQLALKRRLAEKRAAAPQQQANDIHSCSYYCTRTKCIKAQRDELRDRLEAQQQAEPCIGNDPSCPCQDGDLCHYRDSPDGKTKAMPIPQQQAEPGAWQGIHDPTDLYYRKPPQGDVRPLYASPRITAEQVEQIKRLADEYARFVADEQVLINWNEEALLAPQRAALHAALDALRAA